MTGAKKHWYPFDAHQTLNITSEIGPIATMFVVNFALGIEAGVWSLVITTVLALAASLIVLKRPPVMPFIAGAVTIAFGSLTLITKDPVWVVWKVTVFNGLLGTILLIGVLRRKYFFEFVFGKSFRYSDRGWRILTLNAAIFFLVTAAANHTVWFLFQHAHILCPKSWHWLFRKDILTGIDIWMVFKLFIVMPLTSLYFVWQVRRLQRHRLPDMP
ncbi:MAG: septation protein IspZ [Proteobacteria bacterium]|nr:septation protein IspZ [Pseudomonadota bacterium]